ncbi:MAG TPA: helix-turn-helix transcriptional regulator [Actinomycetota bacterium]|nr:helix-turn-helix transcriptional regulator [Actinomycetota bacterium]
MSGRKSSSDGSRSEQPVYVISVAAELAGVHPQTLRVYERKGLLRPTRTTGNTRRYSASDIRRLQRIQELTQDLGVNLAGARMILDLEEQLDRVRRELERSASRLQKSEARLADEVRRMAREAGAILPASATNTDLAAMLEELQRKNRRPIPLGPAATS